MKKAIWAGIIFFFLSGCQNNPSANDPKITKLTPYVPLENMPVSQETFTLETEIEPVLVPTKTPVKHIVALGETFSSIALQYGVTINAIKDANPETNPNTLIVGDELLIPMTEHLASTVLDPEIGRIIQFSEPNCVSSRDDGLWCGLLVENKGELELEELIVTFSFFDIEGSFIEERNTPLLMRHLQKNSMLPTIVFLKTIPDNFEKVVPSVFSVQILDPTEEQIILIEVEDEQESINGNEANVSGRMRVVTEEGGNQVEVWIGAAAFDENDALVGLRRLEKMIDPKDPFDFNITVYAAEKSIAWVKLYAEARLIE